MSDIYRGGTLIVPLQNIEIDEKDYTFQEGDKVIFAIKKTAKNTKNVLKKEVKPKAGEKSTQVIFTAEDTLGLTASDYILQADLINSDGTFPMILDTLKVVGYAISDDEVGE